MEPNLPGMTGETTFSVNRFGFRGRDLADDKPSHELRVFMLGGSSTECAIIDDAPLTTAPRASSRTGATSSTSARHSSFSFVRASAVAVPLAAAAALVLILRAPSNKDVLVPRSAAHPDPPGATSQPTTEPTPETTFKGTIPVAVIRERAGEQARFTRTVRVRPGDRLRVEVALDREQANVGWSAIPTGNLSFTFIPTSGRGNYHLTTTLGIGVEGFVDPLAQSQGVAPRLAFNWGMTLVFFEDWLFTPSASLFTPLSTPPATGEVNSLNETLVAFSVPLEYRISDELAVALGARISGRGNNLRAQGL